MFVKYYFKIKHVKKTDNAKVDALSKKKLQNSDKMSKALLKLDKNKRIWYNHLQLMETHEAPESL